MSVVGIIPARSGSKRLPGKNTKLLAGKPLIQWTIEAALESRCIDIPLVTSDSETVIGLANSLGNLAPFVRPGDLASDTATSFDVANHAIELIEHRGQPLEYVVFLQPTSPLRTAAHIDEAFERFLQSGANSLVSVCECEKNPLWTASLSASGTLSFLGDELALQKRGQDLPKFYSLNGAIYIISTAIFREKQALIDAANCVAYIMSMECSVDIDTINDFRYAETLLMAGSDAN